MALLPTRRQVFQLGSSAALLSATEPQQDLRIPDPLITEAYTQAAVKNVLAAVNPKVFPGYFSVCADGRGFGYGNTYPSLDGHQMTDALLWLGQVDVARNNWDYVRGFQRDDGLLPIAILPASAGKDIGPAGFPSITASTGALYTHWVPGNPLAALASPTYIQNADVIFRRTLDRAWLAAQIESVNRSANYLESLTDANGAVRGGGYYIERPARLDRDGVTQPHAVDAFLRVAALNRVLKQTTAAARYEAIAARIRSNFQQQFWVQDHFIEYISPGHGAIDSHGLSDTNWAALAFGVATPEQERILWPRLVGEKAFYYGGMPTGIVTEPDNYEGWEFSYKDRMDVAAMGRVWYLECAARARMGDAAGLIRTIHRVCETGRDSGYYWRERYTAEGPRGAEKYCEYPANLIRIVQRFVLGVDIRLDGTVALAPVAPPEFWRRGFGQALRWQGRVLDYRLEAHSLTGAYSGDGEQGIAIKGKRWTLPAAHADRPHRFHFRYA